MKPTYRELEREVERLEAVVHERNMEIYGLKARLEDEQARSERLRKYSGLWKDGTHDSPRPV